MSDAATLGILRDLFAISGVALLMAVTFYAVLRKTAGAQWSYEGNVLARPYGWPEALMGLVILGFFMAESAAGPATAAAGDNSTPVQVLPLLAGMTFMLTVALVLVVFLKIRGLDPAELFGIRQMPPRSAIVAALAGIVVAYMAMIGINWLVITEFFHGQPPDGSDQEAVHAFRNATGPGVKILLAFAALVVAPVAEEAIFRGFLYAVTKRFTDRWFSAVFTSVIFACIHRHVGSIVPLFVLALGFSIAYEATGCLLVPMFMHSIFNGVQILLLSFLPQS